MDANEEVEDLLNRVWSHYEHTGKWPLRKRLAIELHDQGRNLERVLQRPRAFVWSMRGDPPEVRASFDGLATLSSVRALLEPLPRVLEAARAHYRQHFGSDERYRFPGAKVREFWSNSDEGDLACRLLHEVGCPGFQGGGSNGQEMWFSTSFQTLRVTATTVEDLRRGPPREPVVLVGDHPTGRHRRLLDLVFAELLTGKGWPFGVELAVRTANEWDLPHLANELAPRYLKSRFQDHERYQLELTPEALPFIPASDRAQELLLAAIRALAFLWRDWTENRGIPVSLIAKRANVSLDELRPLVRLLEAEPWSAGGTFTDKPGFEWAIAVGEQILDVSHANSWGEYLKLRQPTLDVPNWEAATSGTEEMSRPVDTEALVGAHARINLLMTEKRLLRVAHDDLDEFIRAASAEAWKASLLIAGSLCEGVLLDVLGRNRGVAKARFESKWPDKVGLGQLIDWAFEEHLLQKLTADLALHVRNFRDYIHPNHASKESWAPGKDTAETIVRLVAMVISDLESASQSGDLTAFETKKPPAPTRRP